MHSSCAAQAFADEGSATCCSVFQHCINVESPQYYTIKPFASPSASLLWERQNVTSVCFLSFLSNECDNQLYIVMVHLSTALPKQGSVFFFNFIRWQVSLSVIFCFCFIFGTLIFTFHCTHTDTQTHRLTTMTLNQSFFSWLVFTNLAGIVQQRVRPSPFRAAPLGLKEWIAFWKLGPVWDFFLCVCFSFFLWEQRYREQLTIALPRGAFGALHLITWKL